MKDIRKITVTGNGTYYVTLPRWIIEKLKWRKGQRIEIKLRGNKIQIEDWKKSNFSK
jgi:Ni/Co efflux regulator RcnB